LTLGTEKEKVSYNSNNKTKMKINSNTIIAVVLDIALAITCYFIGMSDGVKKERKRIEIIQLDTFKIATNNNK
jgi:hypothetical protein